MNKADDSEFYAEQITALFEQIRQSNGRRYSYRQVARGTKALYQKDPRYKSVTASYISKLTSGKIKTPSFAVLESLAKFFGIDVSYFSQFQKDDQQKIILQRQLLEGKVLDIANQANHLTFAEKQMVLDMMKSIQQVRGSSNSSEEPDAN